MTARRRRCSRALEVHQRPVALEVARRGEDEVGPADGEAVEHRDRDHALARARRARAPTGRLRPRRRRRSRSPIGSGFASSSSAAAAQAAATPRAFGVAGRWKAPQPGLPSKPSACAASARRAAAAAAAARPDQDRRARRPAALPAELVAGLGQRVQRRRGGAGLRRDVAGRPVVDDLGAVPPRGLQPQVDDGRALGDLVVADDDDELGLRERRERQPERVRAHPRSPPAARRRARRSRRAGAVRARTPARSSPCRRAR